MNSRCQPHFKRMVASAALVAIAMTSGLARGDESASYYHQAMVFKQQGRVDKAIDALKAALEIRENYAAAHFSLGILYRQQKETELAMKHLERASKLDSKSAQTLYSLGLAYHQANRLDDALVVLTKAAGLAPKDDAIHAGLGALLIRKEPARAIQHLLVAVKIKPDDAEYLHQLGLAYRKANQYEQAEKYLLRSSELKPNADTEFDLGVLYRRLEKQEKAKAHYEEALRLNPKLAAAAWDIAHIYTQLKQYDEAIQAYRTYLKLSKGGKDNAIAQKRIEELKGQTSDGKNAKKPIKKQ